MSEAGGSGAGAALGGAIANVASVQSPPSKQSAKVHGANRKADKLDAEQNTLCKTCGCPAGTLKANILKCDGGTGVWNKAKAAIGKEPTIEVGPVDKGFHGQMTPEGAKIEQNPNCCEGTQFAILELTNRGARYKEQIEYEAAISSADAFNSCKEVWGCKSGAQALYAGAKSFRNFNDYMDALSQDPRHSNEYRQYWDDNYKSAFDEKNSSR